MGRAEGSSDVEVLEIKLNEENRQQGMLERKSRAKVRAECRSKRRSQNMRDNEKGERGAEDMCKKRVLAMRRRDDKKTELLKAHNEGMITSEIAYRRSTHSSPHVPMQHINTHTIKQKRIWAPQEIIAGHSRGMQNERRWRLLGCFRLVWEFSPHERWN